MSTRWMRVMAAAGLAVSSILAAAPAQADECLPLDVSCVAGDVVDGVDDVVEDTVDTVTDTVDPIAEGTTNTVDELLGGGQDDPPAGGGGGDGNGDGQGNAGGGNGGGGNGNGHGHRDGSASHSSDDARLRGLGSATRPPIALGTGSGGSYGTSVAPASGPAGEQPGLPHRIADTAARAAKSLAIVLVLLLAAVGFVLIQGRLDKKDPRLALAPLQSDVARFD
jgi:hypothetical protein